MEDWEKQEGLIPQHELWKGFRGFVLWLIVAVVSYMTILKSIYDGISASLLHKYGSTAWMPDAVSVYYYIGSPVLKFVSAILLACIVKKILNCILKSQNKKIEQKNAAILAKNIAEDGSYLGNNQNLDASQKLLLRLTKGKAEVAKYEGFLKKKDFDHSFYYWKNWYAIPVAIVSLIGTSVAAYLIVLVLAIILSIVFLIMGTEPPDVLGTVVSHLINILSLVFAIVLGVGSIPFSKRMRDKADRLQEEDERNGYSQAIDRVIWDVPSRYRRSRLMGKLIHIVKKKKVTTVEEAIKIYERNIAVKKGIVAAIYILIFFGIANGINNALNDAEQTAHDIAGDIGRRMDESKAESEMIRARSRRESELRNAAAAKQRYADNSRANAAGLRGTNAYGQANQWANHHQRAANAAWDELNKFKGN